MSRAHNTNSPRCWCVPVLEKTCGDCDGDGVWKTSLRDVVLGECPRCGGRGRVTAGPNDSAILVIHNDVWAEVGMVSGRKWPPREDLEAVDPPEEEVPGGWWMRPWVTWLVVVLVLVATVLLAIASS